MRNNLKYRLLLLCTMFIGQIYGQNFKPINENNISFFSNSNGNVKAVKIDSITLSGKTPIYHLNKVWNFNDYQCIKSNGASWLGKEFIKDSDKYLFFNKVNDTLAIKPNESLNSSWVFYRYNDGRFIQGKIIKKDKYDFFDTADSIVGISLQLMNTDGSKIDSDINKIEIQISKYFGFVKIFSLLDFPDNYNLFSIIGITNPKFGKTFLTERDIYNFDVNDEFHYDIAHSDVPDGIGRFTKLIKKIISKYKSTNTDTVIYSVQEISQTQIIDWKTFNQSSDFSVDTINEKYVFKDTPLLLPEQPNIIDNYKFYYLNLNSNNRLIFIPSSDLFSKEENDCWRYIFYSPVGYSFYMEGCGLFSSDHDNFPSQSHETLVYYKKSKEVWGKPFILNSISDIKENSLSVYPNPLGENELLTINIQMSQPIKLQLYDLVGKLQLEVGNLRNGENRINVDNLRTGVYVIRITDRFNNCEIGKLIKNKLPHNE